MSVNDMSAPCPNCCEQTAKRHCQKDDAQCHWIRCTNAACGLVADMARGKGFRNRNADDPHRDSEGRGISHMPWSVA